MLHGSETWPVRKENEVTQQRAETITVRWMCDVKVKDRVSSKQLRERLGIDDVFSVLQQNRLRTCDGIGMCCERNTMILVKKCMQYEEEGSRPRGSPNRTLTEVVQKDYQARKLSREDAMDRGRWRKLIKDG